MTWIWTVWMSFSAIPRSLRVVVSRFMASLLPCSAATAVGASVTTPSWISATSGRAETFPVPDTEIVRDSRLCSWAVSGPGKARIARPTAATTNRNQG